ncbi:hypothetical protein IH781_01890 [Patescibacteria group bacterium]|nr:hypothetical protein [Patescibacteria group bacterium]
MKEKVFLNPAIVFVVFGAMARLIPHPPNFAPIAALALFGGAHLHSRIGLAVPLAAMFVSDLILLSVMDVTAFSPITPFVYGSFLGIGLIGIALRRRDNWNRPAWIAAATLASSLLFFIVSNFGVWAAGYYPPTLAGLVACYIAGLPFLGVALLGDSFYSVLLFGGFERIGQYMPAKWRFA